MDFCKFITQGVASIQYILIVIQIQLNPNATDKCKQKIYGIREVKGTNLSLLFATRCPPAEDEKTTDDCPVRINYKEKFSATGLKSRY